MKKKNDDKLTFFNYIETDYKKSACYSDGSIILNEIIKFPKKIQKNFKIYQKEWQNAIDRMDDVDSGIKNIFKTGKPTMIKTIYKKGKYIKTLIVAVKNAKYKDKMEKNKEILEQIKHDINTRFIKTNVEEISFTITR